MTCMGFVRIEPGALTFQGCCLDHRGHQKAMFAEENASATGSAFPMNLWIFTLYNQTVA